MKFKDLNCSILFDLSKEVLKEYPIDFSDLAVDEEEFLRMICIDLLDKYKNLSEEERLVAMISSNAVLVLENFLLNLKLNKTLQQSKTAV